jgi:endonuclease/exonuclease/phosphatase family metal-dependent hydrolase
VSSVKFGIMTWNLENLFLPGHVSGPKSTSAYYSKLNNLARTILAINPDVIGLQEVGDPSALAHLQGRLNDRYPYVRLSRFPDGRGIRVGYLSRLPLLQAADYDTYPPGSITNISDVSGNPMQDMGRGALKVTVVLEPGLLVNMVNVHLKSKLLSYPDGRRWPLDEDERARGAALALIRRATEATAVRVYLNRLLNNNNDPLILMGDLNDSGQAVTTQILLGPEDRSLTHRDKFDDTRLYLLDEYIPTERRFSRMYQKRGEMIDHLAVSHELIFFLKQADSYVEPISSIDSDTESRRDSTFPDHAPVFARFEIPQEEADRNFSVTR